MGIGSSQWKGVLCVSLVLVGWSLTIPLWGQEASPERIDSLRVDLQRALQEDNRERVKSIAMELLQLAPKDASIALGCGESLYRSGHVAESLVAFDRVIELQPRQKPYLWQRGIALYDLGKYELGREQFEVHREVNGNDVENATWHYLCVAALENPKRAQEKILPAPGDPRIPMLQVYELYAGRAKPEDVYAAAEAIPSTSALGRTARFYAALYVGLWHHAAGEKEAARTALKKALETRAGGYMYDVARVRLDRS